MDGKDEQKRTTEALCAALVQPGRMGATQWLVDACIACGAFGFGMLQMTLSLDLFLPDEFTRLMLGIRSVAPSALAVVAVATTCAPLILRQKLPWPAFAVCVACWTAFSAVLGIQTLSLAGPLVALFTVTVSRSRGECLVAAFILLACVLGLPALVPDAHSPFDNLMLLMNVALVAAVAFAGYAFHVRGEYLAEARARAAQAERLQEVERLQAEEALRTADAEASRRVEAERVRIAHEVHDITAHSLSAVSVQAALALRLMDADPAAAKEAMELARATSKEALSEMRAMIGVLRDGPAAGEMEPTAGTDRLGDVVDFLEAAGVRAVLDEGRYDRGRVPAYVDIALFKVARESATNIVRHAGAHRAWISVGVLGGCAHLEVADDGRGISGADLEAAEGHGVAGMRQRVAVLGGVLEVGEREGGGSAVRVRIPLGSDAKVEGRGA